MAEAHIYLERTISHCVSALLDLIDLRLWTGGARKGFLQKSIAYNDYYLIGLFYFVFVHIRLNLWLRYLTQSSPSLNNGVQTIIIENTRNDPLTQIYQGSSQFHYSWTDTGFFCQ